ncbi:MAG: hypothetical protein ABI867_42710 [Kofleriaceae bacterium]
MRWQHGARGALALLVIAAGFHNGARAEPTPTKRFEANMMVRLHMHENYGVLRAMERLLVHGKVDPAHDLADAIARAPEVPGMSTWAVQMTRVRRSAAALASTPSVNESLREEARLAAACGRCHVDAGAHVELTPTALPPDRPTLDARMARHVWATDRLWESLLANADAPWRAGLDVLAATPLPSTTLNSDRAALARRFQRLASDTRARGALDLPARAAAYGEILVACAGCHAQRPPDQASRDLVVPKP